MNFFNLENFKIFFLIYSILYVCIILNFLFI